MPPEPQSTLLTAYLAQRQMLVRLFTRRAGDAALAEDVIQDLYLKIAALDPHYAVDNPPAFLFRTASNLYLNRIRALSSGRSRDGAWHEAGHERSGDDAIAAEPSPEAQVSDRQQLVLLVATLQQLPEKTQAIFRLHKIDGLSQLEVAGRLGISISSVEKHLSAALKHLMTQMRHEKRA